jgi:hypothetical protein
VAAVAQEQERQVRPALVLFPVVAAVVLDHQQQLVLVAQVQ